MEAILLAIALSYSTPYIQAGGLFEPPKMNLEEREVFWPPDLVPHPNPSWDQPKKDEPEMA